MQISQVLTAEDVRDFHAVQEIAFAHDYVALPADPVENWLPVLTSPERSGLLTRLYVGRVAGSPVGAVTLGLPTLDNLDVVNVDLVVTPEQRRRGYGRELVEHVIATTRELGRRRLFTSVASWPDRPAEAEKLLNSYGCTPVLEDTRRLVDLHASPPASCPDPPVGYRLVQWLDHAPQDLAAGLAYLNARMTLDAPMGDMDYEPEKWDVSRYREKEQDALERRRQRVVTAAVHESGQVAGVTEVAVNLLAPEVAYQWETIVDPDHRGHGLGLVLKSWNHARLAEAWPAVRYINTWNATSNTFMIRVNEAVGFRPMEVWTEYQLDL
jgi:GNAT superfamily N-acetyltransferase